MDVVKYLIFRDFIFPIIICICFFLIIGFLILCDFTKDVIKEKKRKKRK